MLRVYFKAILKLSRTRISMTLKYSPTIPVHYGQPNFFKSESACLYPTNINQEMTRLYDWHLGTKVINDKNVYVP